MAGQLVEIHSDEPNFDCPACGKAVFLEDRDVVFSIHSTPPAGMTIAAGIRLVSPSGERSSE
jgi:hypothetical protein